MLKKICSIIGLSLVAMSGLFSAPLEYDIQDIGTLQTKASEAIAINSRGQILGWYNIDGTNTGKHFFVRDRDGSFHELPKNEKATGWEINWRFLTDDKAYGTFDGNANYSVLYVWDHFNGVVKLGNLPNKEIVTINNLGQVLLKSVVENENGRSLRRPVIWQNGQITKLRGLEGEIGIESEESYGLDMNNKGDVVGHSVAYLSYKNDIYKQVHATLWKNGHAIDLHGQGKTKAENSKAFAIDDAGQVLLEENGTNYILNPNDQVTITLSSAKHLNNGGFVYDERSILTKDGQEYNVFHNINNKIYSDFDTIWSHFFSIICVNDNGEIIGVGRTIYGELHPMLLTPVNTK